MDRTDAAQAAVRQAEAEGLTLQPSDNAAGYHSVRKDDRTRSENNPFTAVGRGGSEGVYLGCFATAEEAALAVARAHARTRPPSASPRPAVAKRAAPPPQPSHAEEEEEEIGQSEAAEAAVRQAAAEGLTLQPSDNMAGYRGVRKNCRKALAKPFFASVQRADKQVHLGYFSTAEEAALAYARTPEAQAQVANSKAPKAVLK